MASVLRSGIAQMGLTISDPQQTQCLAYLRHLSKWNQVHNLTAIRDFQEMITKHLLDSLALCSKMQSGRFIDVGTGAGLPGIPLAICCPKLKATLLDSNQKKINFVEHVVRSLSLQNVRVQKSRVEQFEDKQGFDWVVSRAFASLQDFVARAGHLCSASGKLMAMKGDLSRESLSRQFGSFQVTSAEAIKIPGLTAKRSLIVLEQIE